MPSSRLIRSIEEFKSTKQNAPYIRWRQKHGLSILAYNKMRRELALKRQKILDEGGAFMPGPKESVLQVRWVSKDGKLSYLGVEVNKHEDNTMSCPMCPEFNRTKYKNTMSVHIKRNHIGETN